MRNHAETEEVVQETFLAVFRSFENYRGQSSLLSWIYGIAKNTTNNSLRRAKSQNERIELADEEDLRPRRSIGECLPDEELDLHRFRELLADRLESIGAWQTEIFEMRHFENLSIPEISARTQRSSDAVRSSLYRVKRLFLRGRRGERRRCVRRRDVAMKRPRYDVAGMQRWASPRRHDVAGRPQRMPCIDVASFDLASDGGRGSEAALLADFADFMSGEEALQRGDLARPDPLFRERLRKWLWRIHVSVRSFDRGGCH